MTKGTGYFETDIDFETRTFELEKDCVGAEVHFTFKGQHFIICFPNFSFEGVSDMGHPQPTAAGTRIKLNWLSGNDDEDNYGQENYRDTKNKLVLRFACNHFIVRSKGLVTPAAARQAKQDLVLWRDVFAKWWEVVGYDDLEGSSSRVEQDDEIQGYFVYPTKGKRARRIKKKQNPITITASMPSGYDKKTLKKMLKYSATGIYPPGYYILLIDALKHYNQDKYRQCMLDAATAVEMAMTQLLDNKLAVFTLQQRKLIFEKYRQISGLTAALKGLGVTVSPDIGNKIGTPRNHAIHKGVEISRLQAKDALQVARSFIYTTLPY